MSQKSFLIAFTIAIVMLMTIETEAKRIGCASFGHSCYGGHGKRSDPSVAVQEVELPDQQPPSLQSMIRVMQRRFSIQPMTEIAEREKEVKLLILNILNEVINETYRKASTPDLEQLEASS